MSDEIYVGFEIRSMLLMKETLREMGIDFNETSENVVEIKRPYHNIVLNGDTGRVSWDQENEAELDIITQNYKVAWYRDNLIRQGNKVTEEVKASGEIVIHVTR